MEWVWELRESGDGVVGEEVRWGCEESAEGVEGGGEIEAKHLGTEVKDRGIVGKARVLERSEGWWG